MKIDFQELILAEHSRKQAHKIKDGILKHPSRFPEFMKLFLGKEPRIVQRAAWPLSLVAEEQPDLIKPYYAKLIKMMKDPAQHPAIPRNISRLLQFVRIPEKFQGEVMDFCFECILDLKALAALKASCITILENLCEEYPEIKIELVTVLESQFQYEGPAFQSRARKVLNRFRKSKLD